MELKEIITYIKEKWVYMLILGGIFLVLIKPTTLLPQVVTEDKSSSWFKDIAVSSNPITEYSQSGGSLTNSESKSSGMGSVEPIQPVLSNSQKSVQPFESNTTAIDYDKLLHNKMLIQQESIRQEPYLSKMSSLNFERNNKFPTIDYVLAVLEEEVGAEYLYNSVQRGVGLVMKKIRNIKRTVD